MNKLLSEVYFLVGLESISRWKMIDWMRSALRQVLHKQQDDGHCSVCEHSGVGFLPLPGYYQQVLQQNGRGTLLDDCETLNHKKYSCTHCGASDRDRLYALYISQWLSDISSDEHVSALEIAPSKSLTAYMRGTGVIQVRTADLMMPDVDDQVDITRMSCYENNYFNFFICSHVLEHVADDRAALSELFRILKPGGWGIVMVPLPLSQLEIDEDPLVTNINERWRRFGQDDHIRMYSKAGFLSRIEEAGFSVDQCGQPYFGKSVFMNYAISPKSVLYIAKKLTLECKVPRQTFNL